jgi:transcriptional antiterminator
MQHNQYLTLQQLANELNISTPTLKKRIKEKMPIISAIWYGKERKRLYSPNEVKTIKEKL